jgi:hypothetical protein
MSYDVLKWIVIRTIPTRLMLMGFNFCQPFLINRAIRLSQEAITNETTQIGYGLIGAYFLVYVGIAVSLPFPLVLCVPVVHRHLSSCLLSPLRATER